MWGYSTFFSPFGFLTLNPKNSWASLSPSSRPSSHSPIPHVYHSCNISPSGTSIMIQSSIPPILPFSRETTIHFCNLRLPTQPSLSTTPTIDTASIPPKSLHYHPTCQHSARWLPQTSKQNLLLLLPLQQNSPTVRAPVEPLLLPHPKVVEVVLALAVVGMPPNGNDARPVACLLWPVLRVEYPGRRYEVTVTPSDHVYTIGRKSHTTSFERKLTCGLLFLV